MKSDRAPQGLPVDGRPRKGAWIEIATPTRRCWPRRGRPRKGAWIEIHYRPLGLHKFGVAPARGRGLK